MLTFNPPPKGIDPKVYNYLYQLAELLSVQSQQGAAGAADMQQTASAVPVQQTTQQSGNGELDETTYAALKSLIIKTADETTSTQVTPLRQTLTEQAKDLADSINGLTKTVNSISSEYVAASEFGTYIEKINAEIVANPESVTQYYSFVGTLKNQITGLNEALRIYETATDGYICSGIVGYEKDGITPKYGVAVGQGLKVTTVNINGQEVKKIAEENFRGIFTAQRLSFYVGKEEVAWVANNELSIPGIAKLGGITVGRWTISTENGLSFKWGG